MAARNTPSRGSKPDKLMRDALRVALHREAVDADGKPTKRLNIIADRLVEAAMDGDMTAIREIFDRIDGKVVPAVDANEPRGDVTYLINTGIVRPGDGPHGIMLDGQGRLIEGERAEAEDAEVVEFASRSIDRARPAYGRFPEARPRKCIFVGTTNDDKYLRDRTGNRRFCPVKTGKIDLEALARDRDQLWAEAAHYEAKGEPLVIPETLWPAAAAEQNKRLEDDPWQDKLAEIKGTVADGKERISTQEILRGVLEITLDRQLPSHEKRLAGLMRQLGWGKSKTIRLPHYPKPTRGYERRAPPAAEPEEPF